MEKLPRLKHAPKDTERAENVIGWLGLSFDQLQGKITLDVGAGEGAVSSEGEKRGCTIIAVDSKPELYEQDGVLDHIPYAIADAHRLPFGDNTFDFVISHAAPPTTWTATPELVAKTLDEYFRVLKPGGEIRFGSGMGTLDDEAVDKLMSWWDNVLPYMAPFGIGFGKIDQAIRERRSLEFLKTLHPELIRLKPKNKVSNTQAYFVIHKPRGFDAQSSQNELNAVKAD